jgi:hypothetical protein
MKRLAGGLLAFTGVALTRAGPAVGATPVPGQNIFSSGASPQRIVQTQLSDSIWHQNPTVDQPTLGDDPSDQNYQTTGSDPAMAEFGNTTAALDPTQDPIAEAAGQLDAFAATDQPPQAQTTPCPVASCPNLQDASRAATGSAAVAVDEITVPVVEAPIAVL